WPSGQPLPDKTAQINPSVSKVERKFYTYSDEKSLRRVKFLCHSLHDNAPAGAIRTGLGESNTVLIRRISAAAPSSRTRRSSSGPDRPDGSRDACTRRRYMPAPSRDTSPSPDRRPPTP